MFNPYKTSLFCPRFNCLCAEVTCCCSCRYSLCRSSNNFCRFTSSYSPTGSVAPVPVSGTLLSFCCFWKKKNTWAAAWQNQQNDVCTQRRLSIRPVWSVFAVRMKKPWVLSYPLSTQWRLIRLGGCPGWSVFAGPTRHFVGFVMQWLTCQSSTVMVLIFWTDRSGQTVYTQIRLLLQEHPDQTAPAGTVWSGSTMFAIHLHLLDAILHGKTILFKF